jgi:hypothetical protein
MSSKTTGSTSAQPPDITIEEMYTFFGLMRRDPKITGI